jgi:hypothetical protein
MVTWQAAAKFAGVREQHIRISTSNDLVTWSPSFKVDVGQEGAVWAPVPFLDETDHDKEGKQRTQHTCRSMRKCV